MEQVIVQGIVKTFPGGTRALDGISLKIGAGTFGLLGPNGAGKTTLMRILATLVAPTSGTATVLGVPLKDVAGIRQILGYLPQSFGFYPQLSVWETLQYFAHLKGVTDRRRMEDLLELVGLADRRTTKVRHLSGGMRQRLGIAIALLNDPRFLIVDEPTAGLDPEGRVEFRNLITTLPGQRTVLISSHIVEDIAQSAAEVAVINRGQLLYVGTPGELAQIAAGKVWLVDIGVWELNELKRTHFVVATVRSGDRLEVRCLGPGGAGFRPVPPTLEDGYMALLRGE